MKFLKYIAIAMAAAAGLSSCDDYLDVTPPSSVSPELYFTTADQLGYYTLNYYCNYSAWDANGVGGQFPSHADYTSFIHDDGATDNEGAISSIYYEGQDYKVGQSGGQWNFDRINDLNWFIRTVTPKLEGKEITGSESAAAHYLGEAHFLRAQEYFFRMRKIGDYPIITNTLPDNREILIEASKRSPRNVVARFIIADLDSAINMLTDGSGIGGRARITRDVALLLKARVALYEATWEKYFAGTPFVPDASAGWAGAQKEYNESFSYNNNTEVTYFLDQALAAAKEVADNHPNLTKNNKKEIGVTSDVGSNPYYDMFASVDVTGYDEVLMYRAADRVKAGAHSLNQYMRAGQSRGYTQEYANAFLMENGLPIYDPASGYAGDDFVNDTKKNRDWRWRLFMKSPGEYPYSDSDERMGLGTQYNVPDVRGGSFKYTTSTGYKKGKCMTKETKYTSTGTDETASVVFRAAEAYLIYMEAAWERYGDGLNSDAWKYWEAIRERAGVDTDIQKTIAATDLDKEEYYTHDLALYSAGKRIDSKVLYNIRRERRCELISEGFRLDDLYRWRSLDQLKGGKFFLHGAKIFGPMLDSYPKNRLKYDQAKQSDNNVSSPSDIEGGLNGSAQYLSMWRITNENQYYNSGMTWHIAHYLSPIAVDHFLISSEDGVSIETSPIYQNPYWDIVNGTAAQQ
ncbi:MAG: RagB/SusD family nutrient uptake outer membrane protein [Muribaculaceae bacterium]|nr:RagB/SusD family nutrient uptake outer membrane protein [Muribaculaceae bacterium]MDE6422733.1 RagB/SusD family nutrient uptake outer membrane protein [Muribaculaceae bacterium]